MTVRILPSAFSDLAHSRDFYREQDEWLGDYFLDSLFSDIDSLALFGGIHCVVYDFYRSLSKRFPYAIYYRVIDREVLVFRVLDCRRDPKQIRSELQNS